MLENDTKRSRTPIRWAGSKRKLLPTLTSAWRTSDKRYLEAFAGSACLFFQLAPEKALLNDTNEELISAYQQLAAHPILLHAELTQLPVNREFYNHLRASEVGVSSLESAIKFFYLNRYCFNGIYRTNRVGRFNVPFASYGTGSFPGLAEWCRASKQLGKASLHSLDFDRFVRSNLRSGDFVYLDPPYAVSNRRVFAQYSADVFGLEDLKRLRKLMRYIDRAGATFLVSYAQSPETADLETGWASVRRMAQRNVAGFSEHRRKAMEVLISNDPTRLAAA